MVYTHPVLKQDEGFQTLARSVEEYHYAPMYKGLRERTGRISFSEMVRMWYDKAVIKVKDMLLSAGRFGELLLNGLTPAQYLKQEQETNRAVKEQERGITNRGGRKT